MITIHDSRPVVQPRLTDDIIEFVPPGVPETSRATDCCPDDLTFDDLAGDDGFVFPPLPGHEPARRGLNLAMGDRLLRLEAEAIVDEYRPSVGPDYVPTPQEDAEWSAILFEEEERAYDAWIDERARDRHAEAFAYSLPREDWGYPAGYTS